LTVSYSIARYCRISVDDELDRDNVSIENQKAIIDDFIKQKFPGSTLTFFEDRDRSGYSFDQREGYQAMLRELFPHAKIVFATTTTMNPSGQIGINPRTNEEISRYNEIASAVAAKNGIAVNDLFALTKDWDSSYYKDYCHFTDESNEILGRAVAETLKTIW